MASPSNGNQEVHPDLARRPQASNASQEVHPDLASRPQATNASQKVLRITLVRSPLGNTGRHKATVRSLGLRKMHQTVELADSPQLRGMVAKVAHMVRVEEVTR